MQSNYLEVLAKVFPMGCVPLRGWSVALVEQGEKGGGWRDGFWRGGLSVSRNSP